MVNFSDTYRQKLAGAMVESAKLGFARKPFISPTEHVADDVLRTTSQLLNELSAFFSMAVPGYWGNSCQTLSSNIFARLNHAGIAADIVLGNVIINGVDEFETTLESLREEVLTSQRLTGEQKVHAWISLGDDTIVDAALPPRLVKHYGFPQHFDDVIFIGRAEMFHARFKIQYQPILTGTEFFAKTNPPDPLDLLSRLSGL
jgi:hypothetical protein